VDISQDELGGAEIHARVTGSCDFLTDSDEESIAKCRKLLSYLPQNRKQKPSEYAVDTGTTQSAG